DLTLEVERLVPGHPHVVEEQLENVLAQAAVLYEARGPEEDPFLMRARRERRAAGCHRADVDVMRRVRDPTDERAVHVHRRDDREVEDVQRARVRIIHEIHVAGAYVVPEAPLAGLEHVRERRSMPWHP